MRVCVRNIVIQLRNHQTWNSSQSPSLETNSNYRYLAPIDHFLTNNLSSSKIISHRFVSHGDKHPREVFGGFACTSVNSTIYRRLNPTLIAENHQMAETPRRFRQGTTRVERANEKAFESRPGIVRRRGDVPRSLPWAERKQISYEIEFVFMGCQHPSRRRRRRGRFLLLTGPRLYMKTCASEEVG